MTINDIDSLNVSVDVLLPIRRLQSPRLLEIKELLAKGEIFFFS